MNVSKMLLGAAAMLAVGAAALPVAASDDCRSYPREQWLSLEAMKAKAESQGFEVRGIKEDDGCWEIKGLKEGRKVEAYFDPVTGELVKLKSDS